MKSGRFILIAVLFIIFIGFIVFSTLSVSYTVSDENDLSLPPQTLNEYNVTELSLTHSIERDKDGKLIMPANDSSDSGDDRACPT